LNFFIYKIYYFNGEPAFFKVCTERDYDDYSAVLTSYSLEWEKLDYLKVEGVNDIPCPSTLNKMIEYAKILSKPFPFVWVDFYDIKDKVYFGELTFTPAGNFMSYYKESTLEMMGEKLKLPEKYKFI